jgi:hypothetical protein
MGGIADGIARERDGGAEGREELEEKEKQEWKHTKV